MTVSRLIRDVIRAGHNTSPKVLSACHDKDRHDISRALGRQITDGVIIQDANGTLSMAPKAITEEAFVAQAQSRRKGGHVRQDLEIPALMAIAVRVDTAIRAWR